MNSGDLERKGKHTTVDFLMKISMADVSKRIALSFAIEICQVLKHSFPEIVENAYATGSPALAKEEELDADTKDIDIFVKIKGFWNEINSDERKNFLGQFTDLISSYGFSPWDATQSYSYVYDIFLSDQSNGLMNFNPYLWYLHQDKIGEEDLMWPEDDNGSFLIDITEFPNPIYGMPFGWRFWGKSDEEDESQIVYNNEIIDPGLIEAIIESHDLVGYDPESLWENFNQREIIKKIRKLGRVWGYTEEQIEQILEDLLIDE